jgi:hypothetical protein
MQIAHWYSLLHNLLVQVLFSNLQSYIVKGGFVSGTLRPFFQTHLLSCVSDCSYISIECFCGGSLLNTKLRKSLNFVILNVEHSIMHVHNWKIFNWMKHHSTLMYMADISVAKSVGWVWTINFLWGLAMESHHRCSEQYLN